MSRNYGYWVGVYLLNARKTCFIGKYWPESRLVNHEIIWSVDLLIDMEKSATMGWKLLVTVWNHWGNWKISAWTLLSKFVLVFWEDCVFAKSLWNLKLNNITWKLHHRFWPFPEAVQLARAQKEFFPRKKTNGRFFFLFPLERENETKITLFFFGRGLYFFFDRPGKIWAAYAGSAFFWEVFTGKTLLKKTFSPLFKIFHFFIDALKLVIVD